MKTVGKQDIKNLIENLRNNSYGIDPRIRGGDILMAYLLEKYVLPFIKNEDLTNDL